jgi:hypothetical protein
VKVKVRPIQKTVQTAQTPQTSHKAKKTDTVQKASQKKNTRRTKPEKAVGKSEKTPFLKRHKKLKLAINLLTVAVTITALYLVIFTVQVFRVKHSTYDFKSQVKLSCDNYGEAIESYFDSGKWSVNPFNATCTYVGQTRHNEEYKIVFSARLKVKVDELYVDGEKIDSDQIETRLMGTFI